MRDEIPHASNPSSGAAPRGCARRSFLQTAAWIALGGCAAAERVTGLPEAQWPGTTRSLPFPGSSSVVPSSFPGVLPRSGWAKGAPEPAMMNPMLPVRYVTVHHDGMERLELGTSVEAMSARIELYRVAHRGRNWGDIGYHFVIDRAGRIWQGRPLNWQGAHVKDRNEGNVGVLVMGNFEVQTPTEPQMLAAQSHLRALCAYFSVPWARVYSHQEWPGAATLCPGRNLQAKFVALRRSESGVA